MYRSYNDINHFTGEFVLVRTDVPNLKLDVQGRFEQLPPNIHGPVMATQLTSVVAAGNNSATIEVRLRPSYAQWRYRLDVFANGKRVFFDRKSLKVQHFPGTINFDYEKKDYFFVLFNLLMSCCLIY